MAIFYSDSGSFNDLEVSGSLSISGSGQGILTVSGSSGGLLEISDLASQPNIFQISSGSIDVFKIDRAKNVLISGSLIVTGSITGSLAANLNVSAGGASSNVSQLVFSNANGISFGLNNNTLTATVSTQGFSYSYFNPFDGYQQVTNPITSLLNTVRFFPMQAPNVQFDRIAFPMYVSNATNSTLGLSMTLRWGLYTRNVSTLSLLTNYSTVMTFQSGISTGNSSLYHGIRLWTTGITNTLTEGQYYVGVLTSASTSGGGSISHMVISQQNSSFSGLFGAATASSIQYTRGLGQYSVTTGNLPSSAAFSEIYGFSSNILRPSIFYLVSQTF